MVVKRGIIVKESSLDHIGREALLRGPRTSQEVIELVIEGSSADFGIKGSPELPALIVLGTRSPEEVSRLNDRRVRVEGVFSLDPYKVARESPSNYATVIFGPPRIEVSQISSLDP